MSCMGLSQARCLVHGLLKLCCLGLFVFYKREEPFLEVWLCTKLIRRVQSQGPCVTVPFLFPTLKHGGQQLQLKCDRESESADCTAHTGHPALLCVVNTSEVASVL